ncbi:MAG: PAS domain S-box protein [Actinobacteria bacterium]|nr:MAG: PAS domain S-box protein [Actinomycetota bacterium]
MGSWERTPLKPRPGNLAQTIRSNPLGYAGKVLIVGFAYYAAARLGLRVALIERNVTPLWPPTGIALVAFLVYGRAVWPGVALAAFAVNLPISTNALAAGATAAGNTLAPLVAVSLLVSVGFRREIDRLWDAVDIVFLGALLSMLISASVGAGILVLSGAISANEFPGAWAVWWTGDAMGVLVVAPFLLSLFQRPWSGSLRERTEGAALLLLVAVVSFLVMNTDRGLMFLVIPFLGWTAWRFQQRGAAPAALIAAGIASWAAAHDLGPFRHGTLFEKMITLQSFDATVAFSSLFFAALVTERIRDREALEHAAAELEERVTRRTIELSAANELLKREIAERHESDRRLRQREGQLAETQQAAQVGSWEWMIAENRVSWSDEMYRIHGHLPQEFPLTFDKAVEQVVHDDIVRIRANVKAALERGRDQHLPDIEYRIVRPDGAERVLLGRAELNVGPNGQPLRMIGTVQDVTESKMAEREHRIAETLQRSLLPDRLPEIPGVLLAARYVPATTDLEVGGDWYDVVQLPDGRVGLAIGDVAGHGLRAASTMGQLRMALRVCALEERSPTRVVTRLRHLVRGQLGSDFATLVYLVFDPDSGTVRFANAGHPPPLVVEGKEGASYLEGGLGPPLGAVGFPDRYLDVTYHLAAGSTLFLFTDGLVERRGATIRDGLDRLKALAAASDEDLEAMCDHVLLSMVESDVSDDVALLALRPVRLASEPLLLRLPAEPYVLASLRQTLRRWLREIEASPQVANDILIACGEACANVIQHAYGAKEGLLEVDLVLLDGTVEVTVRDHGTWRPISGRDGGHGERLMQGLMDSVNVNSGSGGTIVQMKRRLQTGPHGERARAR